VESWRANASKQAQADLDALLNAVLPIAHQQIGERGRFYPFGATISISGSDPAVMPSYPTIGRRTRSAAVLEWLYGAAREQVDGIRAAGFVADVRASDGDAIGIQLQHRDGIAIGVIVPYRRSRYHKLAILGPMRATDGVPRIWLP
jgi:hypothetical protein